jgi:putative MFS transporter
MSRTPDDFLTLFDNAPLNRRYWTTFVLMSVFDFLMVGYLLAAVAREWHLTYGQKAAA